MENFILHKASSRGHADHGWLNAYHSFSFASWYNPERIQFGMLRVLNDDTVAAGMGFGTHPHDNMEIITIPLEGDLAHKDSMGNSSTIKTGDVQVMSAGTGIQHSEFNPNADLQTKLFQIWLFPKYRNVEPRYQQITLNVALQKEDNGFYIMNIEGEIEVNGEKLEKRDAIGIWETKEIEIKANSDSRFLIMEIPMEQ